MSAVTIINGVIDREGLYANDPDDQGGETMYGITVAVARANGYHGPMKDMPRSVAYAIYLKRYIKEPKFDLILAIDEKIGEELIDTGVNMGPSKAAEFLQRWLNSLSAAKLFVDGRVGPITAKALVKYITSRRAGESRTIMLRALNSIQAVRYLEIAESQPSQTKYLNGWILNRVDI